MNIRKVENGYIVKSVNGTERIADSLEEVFKILLMHFEGKHELFSGDSFGRVEIITSMEAKQDDDSLSFAEIEEFFKEKQK